MNSSERNRDLGTCDLWEMWKIACDIKGKFWWHGLSQQGVWVPFWTPKPLIRTTQDTQIFLCGISKNPNLKPIIEFFHRLIIPMTLFNDIMPYSDELIYVYGWNMSILWSPLKIWTPQNFTTANFRHPVSKSWLRHCDWWYLFLLAMQIFELVPTKY